MKKLLFTVSAVASAMVLQAAEVTASALTFSTPGPDKYADGTTVQDGEVYALVWSQDGVFEGLTADGKVVDANDKLVVALPIAKDGKCPDVVFNIADGYVSGGQFDVVLLDTRKYTDGTAAVAGVDSNGKLTIVNTATKVQSAAVSVGGAPASAAAKTAVAGDQAVATAAPTDTPKPVIKGMQILGDNVVLTVENTVGYLNYAVEGSETVDGEKTVGDAKTGNGTITLVYPKSGDTGFLKVIRK